MRRRLGRYRSACFVAALAEREEISAGGEP